MQDTPSEQNSNGLASRQVAASLLAQVLQSKQPFDDLFQRQCETGAMQGFAPRDRAWVRMIVATCLRRKGQIDDALARFMERPLPPKSGNAQAILSSAAAQLLFLETPPHAAIDLAVQCAQAYPASSRFKGLTNAVLRRLAEGGHDILSSQNAARLNTPGWLWDRWSKTYGDDVALQIALAHLNEPPLDISVKADPQDWSARLGGHLVASGTIRLTNAGRVTELDGFDEGAWWVQDAAAALPARLLGDVSGAAVLDLCAAPGGKTAQLAAAGANVTAVDISKTRMARVEQNLARLGLTAECIIAPATDYRPQQAPHYILLDAPCSSTGTIRRHPDIAHSKTEKTVSDLVGVQTRLIDHALDILAPGGTLVFCTCSLEPEEGEHQAARVVAQSRVQRLPVRPEEIGGLSEAITTAGDLRTLSCHCQTDDPATSGLDGFFATRLQKL